MSYPYGSMAQGQYSEADIMAEMQRSGYSRAAPGGGYAQPAAPMQTQVMGSIAPGQNPFAMGTQPAAEAQADDAAAASQESRAGGDPYGIYDGTQYADSTLYDGAVDVRYGGQRVVGERLLEIRNQMVNSVKPIYTFEKIVEVPQVIVKERTREVPKPQIVERIIEVPKTEVRERTFVGPPTVQYQEQIVEVPQVVVEERVVHVPRREVQERLIEVPKIEYVERIEYEDFIEYREVPVDKIVEVPEIEYRVREVEQFVPQTYIQEYYVDKYVETPITQVQEVERVEHVPVSMHQNAAAAMASSQMAEAARSLQQGGLQGGQQFVTMSFNVPAHMAAAYSQVAPVSSPGSQQVGFPAEAAVQPQVVNSYMSYDPNKVHMMGQFVDPQQPLESKQAGEHFAASSKFAGMPIGHQFLVPHGSVGPCGSMQGCATPPMAPGSAAVVNPFASMPAGAAGNPYQSVPVF
mmetsp:Transcript_55200/g.147329  ORF Transcript_55200/g.147329 Transcript_55200/m.147329 type:complete len:463 (-) Transcript_55200:370-1758(-)